MLSQLYFEGTGINSMLVLEKGGYNRDMIACDSEHYVYNNQTQTVVDLGGCMLSACHLSVIHNCNHSSHSDCLWHLANHHPPKEKEGGDNIPV